MSEYTPTTEEVVDFIRAADRLIAHKFSADTDAVDAFHRWLAAHDAEVRASVVPEIGMPCADTKPHPAHAWQMSATGWCLCAGVVAEEPEWEYGATNVDDDRPVSVRDTLAEGREAQEFYTRERGRPTRLMTRTKAIPAGPWVPVKQQGAKQ